MHGKFVDVVVPEAAWSGKRERILRFPENWRVDIFSMNGYDLPRIDESRIIRSLRSPIGVKPLRRLAEKSREVVIVFDDHTRPTKVGEIAKIVLRELKEAGIRDDDIHFLAALGSHGAMDKLDFLRKLGSEIADEYPVYNHSPFHGYDSLGETSHGTPIEVNGEFLSCDLRIGIGCILPHPMMGFGGGAKIILPGIASINAIKHNHGALGRCVENLTPHPSTGWGKNENNITRDDAEEFARTAGLHFKIDALINGFNDLIDVYCGDFVAEQRAGVEKARRIYSSETPKGYDVIILNTSAKASEASLALSSWIPFIDEESIIVLIANPPSGQITHYIYGKFGKRVKGILSSAPKPAKKLRRLILYSEHPEVDPQLPIAGDQELERIRAWNQVLEIIKAENEGRDLKVAIIPNADIQCPRERLLRGT